MIKSLSVIFPLYNEQHRLSKLFSEIKNKNISKKKMPNLFLLTTAVMTNHYK